MVLVERNSQTVGEADPLEFSGRTHWKRGKKHHLPRDFEISNSRCYELANLSFGYTAFLSQHDSGSNVLAEEFVGSGEGDCVGYGGMRQQNLVDLAWRNFFSASIDD